jgi:hypothetical protein
LDPSLSHKEEGLKLLKAGQLDQAIQVLDEALKIDQEDPQIHSYLGAAWMQKGDKLHAIRSFEEALRLEETPRNYYNLGQAYETAKRLDEAIRQYQMALNLDANYQQARSALDKLHDQFAAEHPELQPPPPEPAPEDTTTRQTSPDEMIDQNAQIAGPTVHGTSHPTPQGPAPHMPPGPEALAAQQAEKERHYQEQQRKLMKEGLLYGIICGALFFMLIHLLVALVAAPFAAMFGAGASLLWSVVKDTVVGGIFGGLVGLWIGYTCGGGNEGFIAGAVIGCVYGLINCLMAGLGGGMLVVAVLIHVIIGGLLGLVIGQLVENSIGGV